MNRILTITTIVAASAIGSACTPSDVVDFVGCFGEDLDTAVCFGDPPKNETPYTPPGDDDKGVEP